MNGTFLYVGVIYALAVRWARRGGVPLPPRVAWLFYLLVLVFLWKPMTGPYVNLPVDFIQILPPWAYLVKHPRPLNGALNDLATQIVPWAHQVREAWRSGHFPVWNSMSGSGYPLLANGQSSGFSLLRILALPLTLGASFTCEAAMKILIALTFTYLFCRRRGYGELASCAGAIAFGFCTFVVVWLHFPLVTVAVFLPAVMYQLDLLLERWTYRRFVVMAAIAGVALLGGHPETISHIAFLAALYVLWVLAFERPAEWKQIVVGLVLAAVVGALLAGPFLVSFGETVRKSKRYQELLVHPNEIGYYSDFPSQILLVAPHFFGQTPQEWAWGPATPESITGFAGILGLAAFVALSLRIVIRRRWRDRETFFLVATVIVFGIMMGWPVVSGAFHLVFKMAANARLRLLLCFLLSIQTAAVLDLAVRERSRAMLAGVGAAAAFLLYLMTTTAFPSAYARDTAMLAILPSVVVLLVASLLPMAGRAKPAVMMLVVAAVVAEMWNVGGAWNPVLPQEAMYPKTPLLKKLDAVRTAEPFRIVGFGPAFFPNVPAIFGYEDVRAHDPMANGRYLGLLRVLTGYEAEEYFAKWLNTETRILDYLNVKYVISDPAFKPKDGVRFEEIYRGRDGTIFRNRDVLPRIYPVRNVFLEFRHDAYIRLLASHDDWAHSAVCDHLIVTSDQMRNDLLQPRAPNAAEATSTLQRVSITDFRLRVNAPRNTLIVSSIPYWPGWKVTVNGKKPPYLEQVNGGFLGFVVPPGVSEVRVWYFPLPFYLSVLAALLTIVALAIWPRLRRRG